MNIYSLKGITACFVLAVSCSLFTQPASASPQPGDITVAPTCVGAGQVSKASPTGWTDSGDYAITTYKWEVRSAGGTLLDTWTDYGGGNEYAYNFNDSGSYEIVLVEVSNEVGESWTGYRNAGVQVHTDASYCAGIPAGAPRPGSIDAAATCVEAGQPMTVTAPGWTDPQGGQVVQYRWDTHIGSSANPTYREYTATGEMSRTFSDAEVGTHKIVLSQVTDDQGESWTGNANLSIRVVSGASECPAKEPPAEEPPVIVDPPKDGNEDDQGDPKKKDKKKRKERKKSRVASVSPDEEQNQGNAWDQLEEGIEAQRDPNAAANATLGSGRLAIIGRAGGTWEVPLSLVCNARIMCRGTVRLVAFRGQGAKQKRVILQSGAYELEPGERASDSVPVSRSARRRIKSVTFPSGNLRIRAELVSSTGNIVQRGKGHNVTPPHKDRLPRKGRG